MDNIGDYPPWDEYKPAGGDAVLHIERLSAHTQTHFTAPDDHTPATDEPPSAVADRTEYHT
jgi:hypothetical protein